MRWDLVVVGAGPAGLATALWGERCGLRCAVLDKHTPPFDKACGEGIMPPGVRLLAELGVRFPTAGTRPLEGIRYIDGDVVASGWFSTPGLGVRRTVLCQAMLEHAAAQGIDLFLGRRLEGIEIQSGLALVHTNKGTMECKLCVGADGLHSTTRQLAGIPTVRPANVRYGIRQHFAVAPWTSFVEVHWHAEMEAYITPVDGRTVGVALLGRDLKRGEFHSLLRKFPRAWDQLAAAKPCSSIRGAGPFAMAVERRTAPGVALVGDAAGYADALTGEGITLALRCAKALVTCYVDNDLPSYEWAYRNITRTYYRMTHALLRVARYPFLRSRMIRSFSTNPQGFSKLLAIACDDARVAQLGAGDIVRLLARMAVS